MYIPTESIRKTTPKPRNIEAQRLIESSLNRVRSLEFFGRDTTKTKNQAVKKVPIVSNTVARCGNTAGFTGETYRCILSMLSLFIYFYYQMGGIYIRLEI
uniref:Uncharacterized protein n=1 Tax=Bactrocera dorsalis TaxID=27457 RepID=A0A034WCN1_BACDO